MTTRLRAAVIGFGGMGRGTAHALQHDPAWDLVGIADLMPAARERAAETYPDITITDNADELINDPSIDAIALTTLADVRPTLMRQALAAGKHVWAEKPIGATIEEEEALLELIEKSGKHVCVNLFNRNAAYHQQMLNFIASGEIGEVGVVRVRHQTPGLLPGVGHAPEGPPFHDCGMHYVDVARWYAGSEYARWHAQGVCFWGHPDPWWVDAHGQFENGVVFSITNGFIFGQEANEKRSSCGLEIIGTQGVIVMDHDFQTVQVAMHGVNQTIKETFPYGDKKLDIMASRLAEAINGGPVRYPQAKDSVIASRISWQMLADASENPPVFGTTADLERVTGHSRGPNAGHHAIQAHLAENDNRCHAR